MSMIFFRGKNTCHGSGRGCHLQVHDQTSWGLSKRRDYKTWFLIWGSGFNSGETMDDNYENILEMYQTAQAGQ
jgi:hypothetical protein